jgi:hypothetical protein
MCSFKGCSESFRFEKNGNGRKMVFFLSLLGRRFLLLSPIFEFYVAICSERLG